MGIFSVVFSYIAAVIGAGFASGQETVSFFVRYGRMSIAGIFISVIIFGVFAGTVLKICARGKITDYGEFIRLMFPRRAGAFVKYLTLVFSIVCFCAMAAGSGAMGRELFGISELWGNIILCACAAAVTLAGGRRALRFNAIIGGVIIVGITACCLYIIGYREHQTVYNISGIVSSSVSYAGYNLITAGAVLVCMSGRLNGEKDAAAAGLASAVIMLAVMFFMWVILSLYYGKIHLGELPMLTMAKRQNAVTAAIYAALLFLSVLTTAVASLVTARSLAGGYILPLTIVCAVSFGSAGFANIVNVAYRICGYAGLVLPFYIIIKNLKNRVNERKQAKT